MSKMIVPKKSVHYLMQRSPVVYLLEREGGRRFFRQDLPPAVFRSICINFSKQSAVLLIGAHL